MKQVGTFLLYSTLMVITVSCNRVTPSGFWKNYRKESIRENVSDQGPYGGHRAIHWVATQNHAFSSQEVLATARQNGWQLVDSAVFSGDQTDKWLYCYYSDPTFPLPFETAHNFPIWFRGNIKVYTFKTGWVIYEPGTGKDFEKNGFVVLNESGKQMAIYHVWGE